MTNVEQKQGWKKYLLVASLGFNLLVVFALAGFMIKDGPAKNEREFKSGYMNPMVRALPKEKRGELRSKFVSTLKKRDRKAASELREGVKSAIIAVPFSAENLEEAFVNQSNFRAENAVAADKLWIEIIAGMTDAERQEFGKNLDFRKFRKKN